MSRTVALGRLLFRIRSWIPLPVIAIVAAVLALVPASPSAALLGFGLFCCALGQGLRAWVLGSVPHGTSGQDAYLEAVSLNTHGPYAHVRNPLYLGNFLICAGLALAAANPLAAAIGLGFFALEYAFIVPAEEQFLAERFGAGFARYRAEVPRWLWRLRAAAAPGPVRFDWRRALRKEHNPLCAWGSGLLGLLALQAHGSPRSLAVLGGLELALLVGFVAVKGWKRRWWLAGS